jgi:hypothetical protein
MIFLVLSQFCLLPPAHKTSCYEIQETFLAFMDCPVFVLGIPLTRLGIYDSRTPFNWTPVLINGIVYNCASQKLEIVDHSSGLLPCLMKLLQAVHISSHLHSLPLIACVIDSINHFYTNLKN